MSRANSSARPKAGDRPTKPPSSSGKRVLLIVLGIVGGLGLLAVICCGVGGWFIYDRVQRPEQSRQNMHKLHLALMEYADEHGGEWPGSLTQIQDRVGGEPAFAKLMKNPLTGDESGYEYIKPKGKSKDAGF